MFEFLLQRQVISLLLLLFVLVCCEVSLRYAKRRLKLEFESSKDSASNARDVEQISLQYNKRVQVIDLVRLGIIFFFILIGSLLYDVQAFSYLLLALGALIIAMRETVNSLLGYFFVLTHYDIGDDVRVNGSLGEIVRIKPVLTSLAGKDDNGEYNGKLIHIPNYFFLNSLVERQELRTDNYRRVLIQAVYNSESFGPSFEQWLDTVKGFLDDFLPMRKLEHVGNYRGFAGTRYKINYDYDEDGEILVKISFVADPSKALARKEKIVSFIESLRIQKSDKKK
ncbi:MAG: hypothetical protein RI911_126 [Candidatus Parcubacteria bacterium]|jgi:hypothetical protein